MRRVRDLVLRCSICIVFLCVTQGGISWTQESQNFKMKRITVTGVTGRASSATYVNTVSAVEVQGAAGVCPSGMTSTMGFWSVLGPQGIPIELYVTNSPLDPNSPQLSWSGQAAQFNVYRSTSPANLASPMNLLLTTGSCGLTDTNTPAETIVYYEIHSSSR